MVYRVVEVHMVFCVNGEACGLSSALMPQDVFVAGVKQVIYFLCVLLTQCFVVKRCPFV